MKNFLIILAAGNNKRLKSKLPKPYILINNKPLLKYSIDKAKNIKNINKIVIVYNKKHKKLLNKLNLKNIIKIQGGNTRAKSAYNALKKIRNLGCKNILIHDAARPNTSINLYKRILLNLKNNKYVIPVLKVKDSVKAINNKNLVINIDRKKIHLTQTPQGFHFKEIYNLHKNNKDSKITDDSSLAITCGKKIKFINGEENNIKITNKKDLSIFKKLKSKSIKFGIGFDIHRLEKGRKLYLGGIKIPYHSGLIGHTDGDVIIHALIDGILGACKLNDIGTLFSNKKSKFKNIRSQKMLKKVLTLMKNKQYSINNIDINVITERPKINRYRNKIINSICNLCNINQDQINIKGKTAEKLGLIGKEKAIAAEVIASVIKYD